MKTFYGSGQTIMLKTLIFTLIVSVEFGGKLVMNFKHSANNGELILPLFCLQCGGPGNDFFPGRLLSLSI